MKSKYQRRRKVKGHKDSRLTASLWKTACQEGCVVDNCALGLPTVYLAYFRGHNSEFALRTPALLVQSQLQGCHVAQACPIRHHMLWPQQLAQEWHVTQLKPIRANPGLLLEVQERCPYRGTCGWKEVRRRLLRSMWGQQVPQCDINPRRQKERES